MAGSMDTAAGLIDHNVISSDARMRVAVAAARYC